MSKIFFPFPSGEQNAQLTVYGVTETETWTNGGGTPPPPPDEPTENPTITRTADYQPVNATITEGQNSWHLWDTPRNEKKWSKYSHSSGIQSIARKVYLDGALLGEGKAGLRWAQPSIGAITIQDTVTANDGTVELFESAASMACAEPGNLNAFSAGDIVLTAVPSLLANELRCDIQAVPEQGPNEHWFTEYSTDGNGWSRLAFHGRPGWRPAIVPNNWPGGDIFFRSVDQFGGRGPILTVSSPATVAGDPVAHINLIGSRSTRAAPAYFSVSVYPEGFGVLDVNRDLEYHLNWGDPGEYLNLNAISENPFDPSHDDYYRGRHHAHVYREVGTYTFTGTVFHKSNPAVTAVGTRDFTASDTLTHFGDKVYYVDPTGVNADRPAGVPAFTSLGQARDAALAEANQDALILVQKGVNVSGEQLDRVPVSRDFYLLAWGEGDMPLLTPPADPASSQAIELHNETFGVRMVSGFKYVGNYDPEIRMETDAREANLGPRPINFLRSRFNPSQGVQTEGTCLHNCDLKGYDKGVYATDDDPNWAVIDTIFRGGFDFPILAGQTDVAAFVIACDIRQQPLAAVSGGGEGDWPSNVHPRHDSIRISRLGGIFVTDKSRMLVIGNHSSNREPQNEIRSGRGGFQGHEVVVSESVMEGLGPNLMRGNEEQENGGGGYVCMDSNIVVPWPSPTTHMVAWSSGHVWRNNLFVISDTPFIWRRHTEAFIKLYTHRNAPADFELGFDIYNNTFLDMRTGPRKSEPTKLFQPVNGPGVGEFDIPNVRHRNNVFAGPEAAGSVVIDTGLDLTGRLEMSFTAFVQATKIPELSPGREAYGFTYTEPQTQFGLPDCPLPFPQAGSSVINDCNSSIARLVAHRDITGAVRGANPDRGAFQSGGSMPGLT